MHLWSHEGVLGSSWVQPVRPACDHGCSAPEGRATMCNGRASLMYLSAHTILCRTPSTRSTGTDGTQCKRRRRRSLHLPRHRPHSPVSVARRATCEFRCGAPQPRGRSSPRRAPGAARWPFEGAPPRGCETAALPAGSTRAGRARSCEEQAGRGWLLVASVAHAEARSRNYLLCSHLAQRSVTAAEVT